MTWTDDRDTYLREMGLSTKSLPFNKFAGAVLRSRQHRPPGSDPSGRVVMGEDPRIRLAIEDILSIAPGVNMENTAQMLKAINAEVNESKQILQSAVNDLHALSDVVQPALLDLARNLRSSRMTVVNEVRDSLIALRDLRKFFLETDYALEVERLERFIALCRELQTLKSSGVLDAVSDVMLRLALKEKKDS